MVTNGSLPERCSGPRILVPEVQRACAPLVLRVVGLPPGAVVSLRAVTVDRAGRRWLANAVFRSRDTVIDVARDASIGGSYRGVDPDGLLTTLRPHRSRWFGGGRFAPASPDRFLVSLDVRSGDAVVATETIARVLVDSGVTVRRLTGAGKMAGAVWQPPCDRRRRPPVVVLAPAGSSMAVSAPGLLASRGYPVVAMPLRPRRSGLPGSPVGQRGVRVEDVERVLAGGVEGLGLDLSGAALLGVAEGAEAALRVAADLPDVGAIVAYLPARRRQPIRLARAGTPWSDRTVRHARFEQVDVPLLVVAQDPDEVPAPTGPGDDAGRTHAADTRWFSTDGWAPLGPGRLPGDAQGGPVRHVGGEAWDLVLDLLRSQSISHGPSLPDVATMPVSPLRRGPSDPGRSAR